MSYEEELDDVWFWLDFGRTAVLSSDLFPLMQCLDKMAID